MTKKDWDEALNGLDPDLVEEYVANLDACPRKKSTRPYWFAAVAAVLVLAIGIGALAGIGTAPNDPTDPAHLGGEPTAVPTAPAPTAPTIGRPADPTVPTPVDPTPALPTTLLSAPKHPIMAKKPNEMDYLGNWDGYLEAKKVWLDSQAQQYDQPEGYADSLTDFFRASMAQFLKGSGNPTYSPLNVYMAMAILAETAGGNSRQQILDLFGLETIEELREQASHVWNAHFNDDGETTLKMANSMWLDALYTFHQSTTDLLAEHYFASSFRGDLGSADVNKKLQAWLNENTGGLLKDQAQNVNLDPQTVFALASTVYFAGAWEQKFSPNRTKDAAFHTQNGTRQVPFMNQTLMPYTYYRGANFGAIALELSGENKMWLILPNEGYTVADVLESDDYLRMTLDPGSWKNQKQYKINLSLPKFDVVSQCDLIDGMKNLGITDIFNGGTSDFTPMTDTSNLYVSQINHAARVTIDEEGCEAAAFTVIAAESEGVDPQLEMLKFLLDRPFLFVVSSRDNLPLFAGIVNDP